MGAPGARGLPKPPRRVPFHRRRPPVVPKRRRQRSSAPAVVSVPSYPRSGQALTPNPSVGASCGGDVPVPSVGSPASAAPSPLPNPHSQPTSQPPADPTMPTLSPHPPATQPATPDTSIINPKSVSSANPAFSPYPAPDKPVTEQPAASTPAPVSSVPTPGPPQPTPPPQHNLLKRPVLTSKEYETGLNDDEHEPSDLLYDYSTLEAWLNHPVKKMKLDNRERKKTIGDLYASHQPNRAPTPPPQPARPPSARPEMDCDNPTAQPKRTDPYEFDDDMTNANQDEDRKIDANGPAKGIPGNLFTSEGLTASYRDLDQIFDNSDDTSSDEPVAVPTPPNSNKPEDGSGTPLLVKPPRGSGGAAHVGILRPEELCKMFPTPPSMEPNPIASPSGHLSDGQMGEAGDGPISTKFRQEIYPSMGSPPEEQIEDWSYVFRPPVIYKMVGSSKYAPLNNLPSASLPPLALPSHCIYKPSWLQTTSEKTPVSSRRSGPVPPSPPSPQIACPDLPSPASTTSSYLNRNLTSIEPVTTPVTARAPEANALVVNVLLTDTSLNIFRDHNFDSCTLCVCNANVKCVGNIRGADAGYYLQTSPTEPFPAAPPPYGNILGGSESPPMHQPHTHHEEDGIRCNCGFSAVVNRRLSHKSGLFYEDELEITGISDDSSERRSEPLPQAIMELLREQLVVVQSVSNSVHRASRPRHYGPTSPVSVNLLELTDCNDVTTVALEQGRLAVEAVCKPDDSHSKHKNPSVHRWGFLRARGPQCSQDIIRVMKSLQPILQEAVQKKCTTRLWEAPYTVSGPLTWRQFHRLAGRGTDDRCEPQPIPALLVGYEKDWVALSPYALHYWDKLLLEPYSYTRDIAYIVVAPENDLVLSSVRTFFKELSSTYEICRLGRHAPITKVLRDGILRVGRAAATKLSKEPVDEWFSQLGDSVHCSLLKLYAQACKYHLAPHLSQVPLDRTLLDPPEGVTKVERPAPSPMPPPSVGSDPGGDKAPLTPKPDPGDPDGSQTNPPLSAADFAHDDDEGDPPSLVIYLVDPFTLGSDSSELQRLACLALLRCFTTVLNAVPENVRTNLTVQLVSVESILELGRAREAKRHNDHMRSLALSVFSQCRRQLVHSASIKSLTGFGTAAMAELFLKNKDEKNRAPYRLYSPPYVLAPHRDKVESAESFGKPNPTVGGVMYVSYCLSSDQRFILTAVTDQSGSIFESTVINIEIPNRTRRKKASARRIGLQKLMDFVLGVISQSVQPWRLVIGRIGRIGHGELKGWSWLLSRKSLLKSSKHLREICNQCSLLPTTDVPSILSACLVSLEPDSALRLMPDQFTPDERFSQTSVNCQLSTPQDVTCTHILVFPTSARTQSSQTAFHEEHINGPDLGDDDIFSALDDEDVAEGIDGMQDEFNEIFNTWPGGPQSPSASPRRNDGMSQHGSPGDCGVEGAMDQQNPLCAVPSRNGGSGEPSEDVGTLLQQPLALGYFVSTAPTGPMPAWFWASCPHLENVCPVFLKHALHMHSPNVQQSSEDILQQSAVTVHALDSQYTTDVLRYVLEGFNALSWLALDSNTHDRLSCLPVHVQVLMQLYHMTASLV